MCSESRAGPIYESCIEGGGGAMTVANMIALIRQGPAAEVLLWVNRTNGSPCVAKLGRWQSNGVLVLEPSNNGFKSNGCLGVVLRST